MDFIFGLVISYKGISKNFTLRTNSFLYTEIKLDGMPRFAHFAFY